MLPLPFLLSFSPALDYGSSHPQPPASGPAEGSRLGDPRAILPTTYYPVLL